MRRRMTWVTLIAMLVLVLGRPSGALAQDTPPPPTTVSRTQVEVLQPPPQFDAIQLVLDFAPGAWTPWHYHGGVGLNTVLEGDATRRHDGKESRYTPGQNWVENPGDVHQVGNAGATKLRLAVLFILPKGATLTTMVPGDSSQPAPPGPTTVSRTQVEVLQPPPQFDAIQLVLDFAPGAWTPWHYHGGVGLNTVLEGEATRRHDGQESRYTPSQNWVEQPGEIHQVGNTGAGKLRLAVLFILPKGATLTTMVPSPTAPLPNTGVETAPMLFPETGYSLDGDFLTYWRANGDLLLFGYPIASARQSDGQVTQYLERARFELHPANATPYKVLLGRLGVEALERQGRPWQSLPKGDPNMAHYFAETGHAIAPVFWGYWSAHGVQDAALSRVQRSLALLGYPISEARIEVNSSGDRVLTQWFERARFEYHPNNPVSSRVVLGRLGAELSAGPEQTTQRQQSTDPWVPVSRAGSPFALLCSL